MTRFEVNDIHVHVGKSASINRTISIEEVLPYVKKYDIKDLVLMPLEVETEENNLKILKLAKQHKFIHGFYWIQKNIIDENFRILKKELNNGFVGVKFHGAFEHLSVTNDVYRPIMEFLHDNESIVLVHCGRFKDGHPDSITSFIHGIELAKKYSKIRVVLAHMGGNDTSIVKKAVNAAKGIPNVYFDTSGISTPYRVEYAVEVLGENKVIFGSDYPWGSYLGNYYNVEDSILTEKTKIRIFSQNFKDLILR